MKMCFEVLLLSAHEQLLSGFNKFAKNCLLKIGLLKILAESWCGILKKEKMKLTTQMMQKNGLLIMLGEISHSK